MGLVLALAFMAQGQTPLGNSEGLSITPRLTEEAIETDGVLNESVWQNSESIGQFWQQFPADSVEAQGQTKLQMAYDENNLYIAVTCYSNDNNFVVPSLKRDFSFLGNDNVTLVIDTYNDKTNAFIFGMNPYGVRREALVSNGGRELNDFQGSWDNKWFGNAVINDDHWVAEFAVPFRTLRFKEGSSQWRFNCYRNDTQFNEWSTWNRIPRNRLVMDLSYMGAINWDPPLKKSGTNISIIPYATAGASRDFENTEQNGTDYTADLGLDAKIAITSGLNLDLTINPDFSQVEVDQQVTNLTRFEVLFPEQRQFFLENADLFGSFGNRRINPFFSRRIGIALDTASGLNIPNAITYGARLSGKLNENLRVGFLNAQTAKETNNGLPSFNYTVGALQHKVFNRSNISFIFVNKQAVNPKESQGDFNKYNRVLGLEYRLASADNRWAGKALYHRAFSPLKEDHPFTHFLQLEYTMRKYRLEWAHLLVGQGYSAEVGFVPRNDYLLLSPEAQIYFYPQGFVNQHSFTVDTRFFWQIGKDGNQIVDPWTHTERQIDVMWEFQLSNNTRGTAQITENQLTLIRDFDPTRLQEDDVFLPAGTEYHFIEFQGMYTSDQRKSIFYDISPRLGQFYNGFRAGLGVGLTYRFQPFGSVALNFNYDYIDMDAPFEPVEIWLVGPRIDLTFSKKVFFTTFIQYNNQQNNLNINSRFQWRFAPVSDFFLVYTDNYLTDSFSQFDARNRALVAKLTYWFNL